MSRINADNYRNPGYPDSITVPPYGDTRNVIDHYALWKEEAIREDLAATALPVELACENFAHDFNIATLVRNANAFNAARVHVVGRKQWDKRGAVGTYLYTPVEHHQDAEAFYSAAKRSGQRIVVFDNIDGAVPLPDYKWSRKRTLMVFGQEQIGVSNLALNYADDVVMIPQRGSVRSLNVGVTSGVALYDYVLRCERNFVEPPF